MSMEGIIFLLNPLILTAFRTFRSLLRWSLFICFTIFSYQSDSKGGYFIFLDICSSNDYFTGNALLRSFLSFPETPYSLLSCWLSWKSRNANFLCLLVEFQLSSGRKGSSIYYLKNHPYKIFLISLAEDSPPKNLLLLLKFFLMDWGNASSSKGTGTYSIFLIGTFRWTRSNLLI